MSKTAFCVTILAVILTATVIRAQTPDDAGACSNQPTCGGTADPDMTYGSCCGDPARLSFVRDNPFGCFDCPQATCHRSTLNCNGGATTSLSRPTSIEECCDNLGGVSFNNGIECITCPVCYLEMDNCGGGTTSAAGAASMNTCCDTEGGASYMGTDGTCNPCPAMCYTDAACDGNTTGTATTTMDQCCDTLGGMGYLTNGQCMQCVITGAGMDPHFAVPLLNGQDMCYSLQGEPYFAFNLISDPTISINSYFIPPENRKALSELATFLGDIGILVQPEECNSHCAQEDITKIAISASDRSVLLGGSRTRLKNRHVKVFVENGTATIKLGNVLRKDDHPSLTVTVKQPPLSFIVQFVNEHLDLIVKDFSGISSSAHGIMGQFLRRPAELTDDGFLIVNEKKIRIEKDDAWEFMHTNTKCLHAKPSHGIQADGIIEGKYTDYIVEGLFSPEFQYNRFKGPNKNTV